MAFGNKNSTPSFALTLPMKVNKQDEIFLSKKFRIGCMVYQTKAGKAHDFNRGMKGRTLELLWEKFQNNSFLYIFMCL